jgi:DNA-binding transcriptional ArsR family regulator
MTDLTKTRLKRHFKTNEMVCIRVLELFSLLSGKIRFRIVCALRSGEMSVSEIIEVIDCGKQSNVSSQLKLLTVAGILSKRREQKQWIYSLADKKLMKLIAYLEKEYMKGA